MALRRVLPLFSGPEGIMERLCTRLMGWIDIVPSTSVTQVVDHNIQHHLHIPFVALLHQSTE